MQCGRQGSCPGTCGMWHPPGYVPDTVYHAQLNARRQHNEEQKPNEQHGATENMELADTNLPTEEIDETLVNEHVAIAIESMEFADSNLPTEEINETLLNELSQDRTWIEQEEEEDEELKKMVEEEEYRRKRIKLRQQHEISDCAIEIPCHAKLDVKPVTRPQRIKKPSQKRLSEMQEKEQKLEKQKQKKKNEELRKCKETKGKNDKKIKEGKKGTEKKGEKNGEDKQIKTQDEKTCCSEEACEKESRCGLSESKDVSGDDTDDGEEKQTQFEKKERMNDDSLNKSIGDVSMEIQEKVYVDEREIKKDEEVQIMCEMLNILRNKLEKKENSAVEYRQTIKDQDEEIKKKDNKLEEQQEMIRQKFGEVENVGIDSQEECERMKELLEKKESIIWEQEQQLEKERTETRRLRLENRKKEEETLKLAAVILDKENLITKMNQKMEGLGTRDLMTLNKRLVKKLDGSTQTELFVEKPSEPEIPDFGILDKLPSFDKNRNKEMPKERGKKILNVSIKRGVADPCFRCRDLEVKIRTLNRQNDKLRDEIKDYQTQLVEQRRSGNQAEGTTDDSNKVNNMAEITGDGKTVYTKHGQEVDGNRGSVDVNDGKMIDITNETDTSQPEAVQRKTNRNDTEIAQDCSKRNIDGAPSLGGAINSKSEEERVEEIEIEDLGDRGQIEVGDEKGDEHMMNSTDDRCEKRKDISNKPEQNNINMENNADERKDHSKLCNEYVWNGKCNKVKCKFAHKKLCRTLRKEGTCENNYCEDGHNLDGICKFYNKNSCWNDEQSCKYLHIRVKSLTGETRDKAMRHREKSRLGHERKIHGSDTEQQNSRTNDGGTKVAEVNESGEMFDVVDEYYASETEEENQRPIATEVASGDEATLGEEEMKKDFLEMGRKHDIWKEIGRMETELQNLKRKLMIGRKEPADRNQSRTV